MFHHKLSSSIIKLFFGMPGRIRTPDLLGRNQLLYPAELRAHKYIYYYKVDFYLLAMLILTAHALYSGVSVINALREPLPEPTFHTEVDEFGNVKYFNRKEIIELQLKRSSSLSNLKNLGLF